MLGDMTIFDHEGNFNLYYLDENRGSVYQRAARLTGNQTKAVFDDIIDAIEKGRI